VIRMKAQGATNKISKPQVPIRYLTLISNLHKKKTLISNTNISLKLGLTKTLIYGNQICLDLGNSNKHLLQWISILNMDQSLMPNENNLSPNANVDHLIFLSS